MFIIYFFETLFPCIILNEELYPKKIKRINSTESLIEYESDYD